MRAEGYEEGREDGRKEMAVNLLKENLPIPLIAKASMLSEDTIRDLAAKLNAES
jgi:predicted transposase YdaD